MEVKIKQHLRITHNLLDDDILDDIEACKEDLKRRGILFKEKDPLCVQAVKLFMRYKFNYDNKGDKWLSDYEKLAIVMAGNVERQLPDASVEVVP